MSITIRSNKKGTSISASGEDANALFKAMTAPFNKPPCHTCDGKGFIVLDPLQEGGHADTTDCPDYKGNLQFQQGKTS